MEYLELFDYIVKIPPESLIKLVISNKRARVYEYNKIVIKPVKLRDKTLLQCESFTDKQAFHKNIELAELCNFIKKELNENFRQLDGILTDKSFSVKLSKGNKLLFTEKKTITEKKQSTIGHNRTKNYILPEGTYVPALYELGVISRDGKIINSQYDKFRQINRFVEIIHDTLKNEKKSQLNIIDFGCGKSYLTFVLYHYLTEIKGISANIVGLDLKKDVIEKCNKISEKYGYKNLKFFCGDIKDYKADFSPDMVITLHACDTATDYALYNSIIWGAKYIFSVPCCQHEVNNTISANNLSLLTDYGIIKERISALITDSLRAKILEYYGYSTNLMEFIDIAHSPKNLLIRSEKKAAAKSKQAQILSEIKEMQQEFSFEQTLLALTINNPTFKL